MATIVTNKMRAHGTELDVAVDDIDLAIHLLGYLTGRTKYIVEQRFGVGCDGKSKTLNELAHELGVTRGRVRQLEARGLVALRQIATFKGMN